MKTVYRFGRSCQKALIFLATVIFEGLTLGVKIFAFFCRQLDEKVVPPLREILDQRWGGLKVKTMLLLTLILLALSTYPFMTISILAILGVFNLPKILAAIFQISSPD